MSSHIGDPAGAINLVNADGACSTAIRGFQLIADGLDKLPAIQETATARARIPLRDILAIIVGWMVLGAAIYYPALQLALLTMCATYMAGKFAMKFANAAVVRARQTLQATPLN
jgi:hypothetical protein